MKHIGFFRFLFLAFFLSVFAGESYAQTGQGNLGKYWINIVQTGETAYKLRIEITASEALRVGAVRVPVFVDASKIPSSIEVRPLEKVLMEVPISFTGKGQGSLRISFKSLKHEKMEQFLVFQLFNSVRGTIVKESVRGAVDLIYRSGGSSSVIQIGRSINPIKKASFAKLFADKAFSETKAVRGILFTGISDEIDGESLKSPNLQDESLKFDATRQGRLASFITSGNLAPLKKVEKRQPPEEKKVVEKKLEKKAETSKDENKSTTRKPVVKAEKVVEKQPPASGPFTGYSNVITVDRLPVRRDWSSDKSGAGHFVELALVLPPDYLQAKSTGDIKVRFKIKVEANRYATGRVFISNRISLEAGGQRKEDYWFSDRVKYQGTLLGEFDTEYDGNDFSFDLTEWFDENNRSQAFISFLNLSRSPLEIVDIRIEFQGVR